MLNEGETIQGETTTSAEEPSSWSTSAILKRAATTVFKGVEYLGESIADFIGLNDSRYQWVIDEYQRRKDLEEEEEEYRREEEREHLTSLEEGSETPL